MQLFALTQLTTIDQDSPEGAVLSVEPVDASIPDFADVMSRTLSDETTPSVSKPVSITIPKSSGDVFGIEGVAYLHQVATPVSNADAEQSPELSAPPPMVPQNRKVSDLATIPIRQETPEGPGSASRQVVHQTVVSGRVPEKSLAMSSVETPATDAAITQDAHERSAPVVKPESDWSVGVKLQTAPSFPPGRSSRNAVLPTGHETPQSSGEPRPSLPAGDRIDMARQTPPDVSTSCQIGKDGREPVAPAAHLNSDENQTALPESPQARKSIATQVSQPFEWQVQSRPQVVSQGPRPATLPPMADELPQCVLQRDMPRGDAREDAAHPSNTAVSSRSDPVRVATVHQVESVEHFGFAQKDRSEHHSVEIVRYEAVARKIVAVHPTKDVPVAYLPPHRADVPHDLAVEKSVGTIKGETRFSLPPELSNTNSSSQSQHVQSAAVPERPVTTQSLEIDAEMPVETPDIDSLSPRSEQVEQLKRAETSPNRMEPFRSVPQHFAEIARRLPEGSVEVRLSPEELGRVRLALLPGDSGMVVHIQADEAPTLELMRRHIDILQNELRNAGFGTVSFAFQHGQSHHHSQSSHPSPDKLFDDDASESGKPLMPNPTPLRVGATGGMDIRL